MKATIFAAIAGSSLVAAAPAQVSTRATKVQYAGVNIAGFDFGCTIDGKCALTGTNKPYNIVSGGTALGQMNHFVKDDGLNAFRLPVGWQFLLNDQLGGTTSPSTIASCRDA
jgi:endoglucanase